MKYIDADKLEDKLIEIEERHPAFCESVYDNAYSNCLNEVRLIISSLLKEQISPLKGKFIFPKFLYARTTNNKTLAVSYAPQSLDAIENLKLIRLNAAMTGAESFKEALDLAIVSLSQPSLPSDLDEAARKYGHEHPILPEYYNDGEIPLYESWTAEAFKAGAEWMAGQGVSLSHLIAWYIQSVDAHEPIWTEGHLEELVKDYILIPKK